MALLPIVSHLMSDFRGATHKKLPRLSPELQLELSNASFPLTLWRTLADYGWLKGFREQAQACPDYFQIAEAAMILTRTYASPGLTMCWLGQLLKLDILRRHGTGVDAFVEAIESGKTLCALAISEPDVGAQPKYLTCKAEPRDHGFILTGKKAYVSQAPHADWFIVLAVSGEIAGRKQFSAFLVPRSQQGLTLTTPEQSRVLSPHSHCDIIFEKCQLPGAALIGTPGRAFEDISQPMRSLEDVLMLAPIAAAIRLQLELLAGLAKGRIPIDELTPAFCLSETVTELGLLGARRLGQNTTPPDLSTLVIGARALIEQSQSLIAPWVSLHPKIEALGKDIQLLSSIGQSATKNRAAKYAQALAAAGR